ncbi:hypothetical protein EDC01DRAFT_243449 [Geopyxis carbonaria]|nr:hypothetical protein EDC01DRAFT_243449 [Geopyxis carbonaria]
MDRGLMAGLSRLMRFISQRASIPSPTNHKRPSCPHSANTALARPSSSTPPTVPNLPPNTMAFKIWKWLCCGCFSSPPRSPPVVGATREDANVKKAAQQPQVEQQPREQQPRPPPRHDCHKPTMLTWRISTQQSRSLSPTPTPTRRWSASTKPSPNWSSPNACTAKTCIASLVRRRRWRGGRRPGSRARRLSHVWRLCGPADIRRQRRNVGVSERRGVNTLSFCSDWGKWRGVGRQSRPRVNVND